MSDEARTAENIEFSLSIERAPNPTYPILDKDEVWDGKFDRRGELSEAERHSLRPPDEEVVIHIDQPEILLPDSPVLPIDIMKRAANVRNYLDIGYMGPTVASVNILDTREASRYQRQHGRDDLIAGQDVKAWFPKLLDTVVVSLAATQGVTSVKIFCHLGLLRFA